MVEFIYKISNSINQKVYIGKSKNVENRWKQHKGMVGKKTHPLYDSMMKYGVDNFEIQIIDSGDNKSIDYLEKKWILEYDSVKNGYNLTEGGCGGDTFGSRDTLSQDITREKLKKVGLKNLQNPEYVQNLRKKSILNWESPLYRNKVKINLLNAMSNPEYKNKISESMKKHLKDPDNLKVWSECKKGDKNGRWLGVIIMYDENENEVKRFQSAVEAHRFTGISAHTIREKARNGEPYLCVKKTKKWYGYKFKIEKI